MTVSMQRPATAGQARRVRAWSMLVLATAIITVDYMDRGVLAVGAPLIRQAFHIGPAEFGALLSVFAWPYALSLPFMGVAVDRWGSKVLLGVGGIIWSLTQLAKAAVTSVGQLFILRGLLGVAESPGYMAATRAVKFWYPNEAQNVPTGIFNSGASLGPLLAPLVLTPIMLAWGWRAMFLFVGIVGLGLAVAWLLWYRDPRPGVEVSTLEEYGLDASQAKGAVARPRLTIREWLGVFRHRSVAFLWLGAGLGALWGFAFTSWLPSYLEISRQVTVAETGVLASLPPAAGLLGALVGGFIPNLAQRVHPGLDRVAACKVGLVGGALVSALLIIPAVLTKNLYVAIALFGLSGFFGTINTTNIWTSIQAVSPHAMVGAVAGIVDFGAFLGAGFGPVVIGLLLAATGSFVVPMLFGVAIMLIGVASFLIGISGPVLDPRVSLNGTGEVSPA